MPRVECKHMEIKEVGTDGVFNGYLSRFNEEDHEGDIMQPGCFTKTLTDTKKGGNQRPMLWHHLTWEPVGVLDGKQDDQGLLITGNLNLEVQRAREIHSLMKQGAVKGLSQGFMPMKWRVRPDGKRGRLLDEVDLWEGSPVVFPSLPSAQVMSVRSLAPPWWPQDEAPDPFPEEVRSAFAELASVAATLPVVK